MTEKDYYAKLTRYYERKALATGNSCVWDAKFTRTNLIAFSCLASHQEEQMLRAQQRAFGYKIPDAGQAQKPFDGFVLTGAIAVLPIIFYRERKTMIYEVPVNNFVYERERSIRKSLTEERAEAISTTTVRL